MWAAGLEYADPSPQPVPNPLDSVIGWALVDRAFCRTLLADPAIALAPTAMPPLLKLALVRIRADSLAQFASRALAAETALGHQRQAGVGATPAPNSPSSQRPGAANSSSAIDR